MRCLHSLLRIVASRKRRPELIEPVTERKRRACYRSLDTSWPIPTTVYATVQYFIQIPPKGITVFFQLTVFSVQVTQVRRFGRKLNTWDDFSWTILMPIFKKLGFQPPKIEFFSWGKARTSKESCWTHITTALGKSLYNNVWFFWVSRHKSIIFAKKKNGNIFGQIWRNSRKCMKDLDYRKF